MESKSPSESSSQIVRWMSFLDANSAGNVHGGTVMKLCDEAAALAAIKHSRQRVVTAGQASLCYLPDHEPGLGTDLRNAERDWISGYSLAKDASLLIHDCQYDEDEYRARRGWGHSPICDAVTFAYCTDCARAMMFHHDPAHDDARLEAIGEEARARWSDLGGGGTIELAREGRIVELAT